MSPISSESEDRSDLTVRPFGPRFRIGVRSDFRVAEEVERRDRLLAAPARSDIVIVTFRDRIAEMTAPNVCRELELQFFALLVFAFHRCRTPRCDDLLA